jgi:hypothetical protein
MEMEGREREARRACDSMTTNTMERQGQNKRRHEPQDCTRPEKRRDGFDAHIFTDDFASHMLTLWGKRKGKMGRESVAGEMRGEHE